jgi:hypothetical protein
MKLKNIQLEKGFEMIKCLVVSLGSYTGSELDSPLNCDESISIIDIVKFALQSSSSIIELNDYKEYDELCSAIDYHNNHVDYNERVYLYTIANDTNEAYKLLVTDYKAFLNQINEQKQQAKIKQDQAKIKKAKQKLIKELTKSGYTEDEITEIINKRFDI